jgi:allophanate hydrolase
VEADPVESNTRLGRYTNFVNLMDLCALAVPSGRKANGLPFGVTLIAPAFQDGKLSSLGARFHAATGLTLGTTAQPAALPPLSSTPQLSPMPPLLLPWQDPASGTAPGPTLASMQDAAFAMPQLPAPAAVKLAVAGLHLSGQPLNSQLTQLGARLVSNCRTAPVYRAFALARPGRVFPGLVRVGEGGGAVELEVWEMAPSALGAFMEYVKEPLCIGTVELETGEKVKGFLCEQDGVGGARDITEFGGWRAYLAESQPPG